MAHSKTTYSINLVYHDLSILYYLFGHLNYTGLVFSANTFNYKEFEFLLGTTKVAFLYDRLSQQRDKKISINGQVIDYNNPSNDAVTDMLRSVLSETVDFDRNRSMCLSVDTALDKLTRWGVGNDRDYRGLH